MASVPIQSTLWQRLLVASFIAVGLMMSSYQQALAMGDALDMPAQKVESSTQSLLLDVTSAGDRLVAVGELGHVLYSDDQGRSWQQAEVPVRVTLTAVHFPTPDHGWAVGHDGVVLASRDSGQTWVKQLDGHEANQITLAHAQALVGQVVSNLYELELAGASLERISELEAILDDLTYQVEDVLSLAEEGPTRPFLEVWFANEREGWALGAFGLVLHTTDGGQSWQSHFGRLDNPDGFHYYAMTAVGEALVIAGEAGTFYRSTDFGVSWETLAMPYEGSMFGLLSDNKSLLAFGLRGHLFRSEDLGESWQSLDSGTESLLAAGSVSPQGEWVLVGSAGTVLTSQDQGRSFIAQIDYQRRSYSSVVAGSDGELITVGQGGFHRPLTHNAGQE